MATRKRSRRGLGLLAFILVFAAIALSYTVFTDNRPLLGLDLQGGVSVVLCPKSVSDPTVCHKDSDPAISNDTLDQAIKIIRNRIDALGVAEPDISRQGNNVLVQIPGVKDQQRALDLVGQTALLEFRPVLAVYPVSTNTTDTTTNDTTPNDTSTDGTGTTDTSQQGLAPTGALVDGESALGTQTPSTQSDSSSSITTDPNTTPTSVITVDPNAASQQAVPTITPDADVKDDATVVLPSIDPKTKQVTALYQLGPLAVGGTGVESASASLDQNGKWQIKPVFKSGADGIDKFNTSAGQCFSKGTTCPTGQMAVVLDNKVLTAPSINAASFARDQITISGNYTEKEAKDIATALRYGALPVSLLAQQSQIVSATLGRDALHAGLVAGAVGFVLVGLYMIFFYRILGVLAMFKLFIEGCILWGLLCYLGSSVGLALTLAGITGIIVSIGVSLDSNVVYYEHLKEDIRAGRTVRAAIDKSFASAWSTILAADGASVIGAFLLYFLTVGAVRGFALYLGIATILDLITSYCYMRPVVRWATSSKRCEEHPGQFGLPHGPDEPNRPRPDRTAAVVGGVS